MSDVALLDHRPAAWVIDDAAEAIMRVIDNECAAFLQRDYEKWASFWVHSPRVRRWGFLGERGIYEWIGWEDQAERVRQFMIAHPTPSKVVVRREKVNLNIGREIAWLTFDECAAGTSGALIDLVEVAAQMKILEKERDGWKIAFACKFHRSVDHVTSALACVDRQGKVIWMNAAARRELQADRGILVRAGRIRATDRLADQRLQAAIAWAGELDDGIWPRRGTLPIMLGGGRGEPANLCCVIARDSQILVSINDENMLNERLSAAGPVFGITPAQMRLARLIVAGHDLVDAAGRLGVSVNTTRTQLQRMFDKTGVRTQPALVRALLSVASPLG